MRTNYPNFEVILVDNASTDGSVEFVRRTFPEIQVLANSQNLGFAEGNNVGLKKSNGKYVVFLNNDTYVDPNWLNEIVKLMESDPTIGACQCKLLFMDDPQIIDSVGQYMDFLGLVTEHGRGERDIGQYDYPYEIFHAKGAAMVVRKEIIKTVGPFDPKLFINFEDADLCWRIWLAGYRVVLCPRAIVYHKKGSFGIKSIGTLSFFHYIKNNIRVPLKNYSLRNVIKVIPLKILLLLGLIILLIIKRKRAHAVAAFNGLLWNILNFKDTIQERKRIQSYVRKVSDNQFMKRVVKPFTLQRPGYIYLTT